MPGPHVLRLLPPVEGGVMSSPRGPELMLAYRAWCRTRTGGGEAGGPYIAARGARAAGDVNGPNSERRVSVVVVAVLISEVIAIRRAEVEGWGDWGEEA